MKAKRASIGPTYHEHDILRSKVRLKIFVADQNFGVPAATAGPNRHAEVAIISAQLVSHVSIERIVCICADAEANNPS